MEGGGEQGGTREEAGERRVRKLAHFHVLSSSVTSSIPHKVSQHTIDRSRLWNFVGHLTCFHLAVKLLYQHCVRDQVRVCAMSKESTVMATRGTDDSFSKSLRESSVLHWL